MFRRWGQNGHWVRKQGLGVDYAVQMIITSTSYCHFCTPKPHFHSCDLPRPSSMLVHCQAVWYANQFNNLLYMWRLCNKSVLNRATSGCFCLCTLYTRSSAMHWTVWAKIHIKEKKLRSGADSCCPTLTHYFSQNRSDWMETINIKQQHQASRRGSQDKHVWNTSTYFHQYKTITNLNHWLNSNLVTTQTTGLHMFGKQTLTNLQTGW